MNERDFELFSTFLEQVSDDFLIDLFSAMSTMRGNDTRSIRMARYVREELYDRLQCTQQETNSNSK